VLGYGLLGELLLLDGELRLQGQEPIVVQLLLQVAAHSQLLQHVCNQQYGRQHTCMLVYSCCTTVISALRGVGAHLVGCNCW